MKGKLAGVFVDLFRKVGILVQHGLDHRPVFLLDVTEQFGLAGIDDLSAGNRPTWRLGLLRRSLSLCWDCTRSSRGFHTVRRITRLVFGHTLKGNFLVSCLGGSLGGSLLNPHPLCLILGEHTARLGLDDD